MEPPRKRIRTGSNGITSLCDDMTYVLLHEHTPKWMWAVTARVCQKWYGVVHGMPFTKCRRTVLRKSTAASAVYDGATTLVDWMLCDMECPKEIDLCGTAVYAKRIDMVKHLRGLDCPWKPIVAYDAIATGDLPLARAIVDMGCPLDENTLVGAVKSGSLDMLEYVYGLGCPVSKVIFLSAPNVAVARWLYARGHDPPPIALEVAMRAHWPLDELKALTAEMSVEPRWDEFARAAAMGRIDVLAWLRDNWRHTFCVSAVYCLAGKRDNTGMCTMLKHMPDMAHMLANGQILCTAIERWPIDDLEWLCGRHGCPITMDAVYAASGYGRIDALEWLCNRGCVPDGRASYKAAKREQWDALLWLANRGFPVPPDVAHILTDKRKWDWLACLYDVLPVGWGIHGLACMPTAPFCACLDAIVPRIASGRIDAVPSTDLLRYGSQLCVDAAAVARFDAVDVLMRTPIRLTSSDIVGMLAQPPTSRTLVGIVALAKRGTIECLVPDLHVLIERTSRSLISEPRGPPSVATMFLRSVSTTIAPLLFAVHRLPSNAT